MFSAEIVIDCSEAVKCGKFSNKFPPSLNSRLHWAQRSKLNKLWRARAYCAIGKDKPRYPLDKVRCIITKYSTRACDWDNMVTQFKPVIDGLVDAGVVIDDSVEHFSAEYKFEKCKKSFEKIHIFIMEAE